MDQEVGPWKVAFFHGPISWSIFRGPILYENQFTRLLGPSLGVNGTWIKRNDHAPKSVCAYLFFHAKEWQFRKKNQI
jgi:hypothetical protein